MALTQGEWTATTVNGRLVLECDVVQGTTTIDYDAWTLKTPANTGTHFLYTGELVSERPIFFRRSATLLSICLKK